MTEEVESNKEIEINKENEKITKRKYDQKKYNKNFMEKHKERLKQKTVCELCKGEYSYYNKSKHNKTKRHNSFVNLCLT